MLPIAADSPELQRFVNIAEQRYDYVNETAATRGAKFLLFWQPAWWIETGQVSPEVRKKEASYGIVGNNFALRHNFTVINDALVARLKNKPYFVDFQNILCPRTEPTYQSDGIHLQDIGREMVARGMNRILKEEFRHPQNIAGQFKRTP